MATSSSAEWCATPWILTDEKTGQLAVSDRGTTAFSVERAIKFLSTLSK